MVEVSLGDDTSFMKTFFHFSLCLKIAMIKPGQRKKRRRQEGGEGAALPPPARCPPGLGPNKNLETVANSRPVAAHPSPACPLQASEPEPVSPSGALSTEPGRGVGGKQVVGGPGQVAPSSLLVGRHSPQRGSPCPRG